MASPGVSNHWNSADGQPGRAYRDAALQDPIGDILQRFKTLAIVGLSPKASRPSYGVASYMRSHGYRVIPVNPNASSVFGECCYASLEDIPTPVDVVVIFRRSEFVPPVVDSAIRIGARVVWMQEGVEHEAAAKRTLEAGLEVVEDRCILKEHAKRFVAEGI